MALDFSKAVKKLHSLMEIFNNSYDEEFQTIVVQPVAHDPTSNTISRSYPANPLNLKPYDYVSRALTNSTTETYTFKSGGSSGTTTNTVVIVYTDSSLVTISTVTKT